MRGYKKAICTIISGILIFGNLCFKMSKATEIQDNIILLIDNSGSMRQTDPNKLSVSAASMLLDTVEENTNVNIIAFGEKVAAPYQLSDKPSREALKSMLLGLKFDQRYTSLKDGLREAVSQLEKMEGNKTIIVISDGKEDPAGGTTRDYNLEFDSLIERAYASKIKLQAIGLSQQADIQTLERISFKTGGKYFYCDNPAGLFEVFNEIIGSISDFYTIENFTTDAKKDKEVKLSSYVDEVIIKIASCENKMPMVDVSDSGKEISSSRISDTYKIYRFKNTKDNTIRISARDKAKNLVMVQVKSKGKLSINPGEESFKIPKAVPLDIEVGLQLDKEIPGLHMDRFDGTSRENIEKVNGVFKFTFKKDKSGNYSSMITAYDGDGKIIAIRNISISVTEDPPFYYVNPLPEVMIADRKYVVEIKKLDNTKVSNPYGEVLVDYGDSHESFPFKPEDGVMRSEISLHKSDGILITSFINGVKDNESFSYNLPYFKSKVIDSPYIELEAEKSSAILRKSETVNLKLYIKKSLIYENEKISVYNSNNDKIGEFEITPKSTGSVSIAINPLITGKKLSFILKPEGQIRFNERISTNITVVSDFSYYLIIYKFLLIVISVIVLVLSAITTLGMFQYNKFVRQYKVSKEIFYCISPGNNLQMVNVELNINNREQCLNLSGDTITGDGYEDNAIGKFILHCPRGRKTLQGLSYMLKKKKLFYVEYVPVMEQEVLRVDEPVSTPVEYKSDIEVSLKVQRKIIRINFS